MATEDRADARAVALLDALRRAPDQFDFFQALRRIECAWRDRPRLGEGTHASEEPVRIGQEPSMAFNHAPLTGVGYSAEGMAWLSTCFLGLLGPNGPLPLHLTEYVRDRLHNASDPTFARFLDLFHHRILSLFYRAFANAQPAVAFDRPQSDRFATYVGALFGLGMPSLRDREVIPDRAKLYFAGRYAAQPRNAEGLGAIVADYFGIPAAVEQFVGEWVDLPVSSRWRLGGPGLGAALGRKAALGKRAWLYQSKFRIVLGPVDPGQFPKLLPGGESLQRLGALVRGYAGQELSWDVRLILGENTGQPWRLAGPARLGWTCWLGARPSSLIVKPEALGERSRPPSAAQHNVVDNPPAYSSQRANA
jgi:type VI secretion system protein ImpH